MNFVRNDRPWSGLQRVAFRFAFIYLSVYFLETGIVDDLIPVETPELYALWPTRQLVSWTAVHVFAYHLPLVYEGSGSGDKVFDWVFLFTSLVFASFGTIVWSLLDRKRLTYGALYRAFRVVVRFALAAELLAYGFDKAIPNQMPYPGLATLIEPFGHLSPMGVLWRSIGASPAYEMFAGCAEILAGLLLVAARTTMLGALLGLADMTQVFALNMTYDVPVKLFSAHLFLLAAFLLCPDLSRLVDVFARDRIPQPPIRTTLFERERANRIASLVQLACGIYLVVINVVQGVGERTTYGAGKPRSALYGIWNITRMSIDGRERPGIVTDDERWRRLVFDAPSVVVAERMDDAFESMTAQIDVRRRSLTLGRFDQPNYNGRLTYERPQHDRLTMHGTIDGRRITLELRSLDRKAYDKLDRGFHWIQDYGYNH